MCREHLKNSSSSTMKSPSNPAFSRAEDPNGQFSQEDTKASEHRKRSPHHWSQGDADQTFTRCLGAGATASQGCSNSLPHTWLKAEEIYILTVLEDRNLKSDCHTARPLSKALKGKPSRPLRLLASPASPGFWQREPSLCFCPHWPPLFHLLRGHLSLDLGPTKNTQDDLKTLNSTCRYLSPPQTRSRPQVLQVGCGHIFLRVAIQPTARLSSKYTDKNTCRPRRGGTGALTIAARSVKRLGFFTQATVASPSLSASLLSGGVRGRTTAFENSSLLLFLCPLGNASPRAGRCVSNLTFCSHPSHKHRKLEAQRLRRESR